MARTALEIPAQEWYQYNPHQHIHLCLNPHRWEQAWRIVPRLATLLREQFGAQRVVVFGSLLYRDCYTHWSDIDLAVEGVSPDRFYQAANAVDDCCSEYEIDLLDLEHCKSSIQQVIEMKGIDV